MVMSNDKFREQIDRVLGIQRGIPNPHIQVSYDLDNYELFGIKRQADIYQPSSDTLLIFMELSDGSFVLQENLENGDIIYHQDQVSFRKCINAMKKILGYV